MRSKAATFPGLFPTQEKTKRARSKPPGSRRFPVAGRARARTRILARFASIALALACILTGTARAQEAGLRDSIRALLTSAPGGTTTCPADLRRDCAELVRLYSAIDFDGVWLAQSAQGAPPSAALQLLRSAKLHGLDPREYGVDTLAAEVAALGASTASAQRARVDVGLTLALLRVIEDVHDGRVNPRVMHPEMRFQRKLFDPVPVLLDARQDAARLEDVLAGVAPPFASYRALLDALARYRSLAARAFSPLPALAAPLRPGMPYDGLQALRERLIAEGDLAADAVLPAAYDGPLVEAVTRFQSRHGLQTDAVVGQATLAELNVPFVRRARQIERALERLRWFPPIEDPRLLVVNIPEFKLWAIDFEQGKGALRFRLPVIVGRAAQTRTPLLATRVRSVEFNPYWNVPASITRKELVGTLRRDPAYLDREDMEILPAGSTEATGTFALDPETLERLEKGELRIRQRPGPRNALGRVKFNMPNELDIYLHDTPEKDLFGRARRDFSHGCIRVADPDRLAGFVLEGQPGWGSEEIREAMDAGENFSVKLKRPIPVVLIYSTVVPDPGGFVLFLPDVYGYDAALRDALASRAQRIAQFSSWPVSPARPAASPLAVRPPGSANR